MSVRAHLLLDSPKQKDFVQPLEAVEHLEKEEAKKLFIPPPAGQSTLFMDGRGTAVATEKNQTSSGDEPSLSSKGNLETSDLGNEEGTTDIVTEGNTTSDKAPTGEEDIAPVLDEPVAEEPSGSDDETGNLLLAPEPVTPEEFKRLLNHSKKRSGTKTSSFSKPKKEKKLETFQFTLI